MGFHQPTLALPHRGGGKTAHGGERTVLGVVDGKARRGSSAGAGSVGVDGFFDAIAPDIIFIIGPHLQCAAVGGALFCPDHVVEVVVAEGPGLQACPF